MASYGRGRGGARGGFNSQRVDNQWIEAGIAVGPRGECPHCNVVLEVKTPKNGGPIYYVCKQCNIAGRAAAYNPPPPPPTQQVRPGPVPYVPPQQQEDNNVELYLLEISENTKIHTQLLQQLIDMMDCYICSKEVSKAELNVMKQVAEKETETPSSSSLTTKFEERYKKRKVDV